MRIVDDVVLDPVEFVPDRAELNLSETGLAVHAANWGDAAIEAFMVRQQLGEEPADRHPPNREVVLKLVVRDEGDVDLPTASYRLQQKIGLMQREGGWLRRDFIVGGSFAGSLGIQVKKLALSDFAGWQAGESPDVTLSLTCGPYWYATEEIESDLFSGESARELIWELEEMLGTAPGLIRLRVTNDNEVGDWRGLISAMDSRDHPQDGTKDTSAALAYEAEDLEPVGGTEEAERTGASGEVVRHPALSTGWSSLLASATMTHVGVRRVWARVYDPSGEAGKIELRLKWKSLGAAIWSENEIVPIPLAGGFALVDLGECRPESSILGEQGWEWVLLARTSDEAFRVVDVDKIYILPTEQYMAIREPLQAAASGGVLTIVEDNFQQSSGALSGKSAFIGGEWGGAGDADDFNVDEEEGLAERTATKDSSIDNGRYGFLANSYEGPITAGVTFATNNELSGRAGLLLRYQDVNNWLRVCFDNYVEKIGGGLLTKNRIVVEKCVGGVVTTLGLGLSASGGKPQGAISVNLNAEGELTIGRSFSVRGGGETTESFSISADADLAEGGALDAGKVGIYDSHTGGWAMRRKFTALWAREPEVPLDKATFAGRSIELRSDGAFRQHPLEDKWARLVPEGFLPYGPPSGLEGRHLRGIVIPSRGDLGELPDAESNDLSLQVLYRPAYHFAREAS